jgi:hypothetical protein
MARGAFEKAYLVTRLWIVLPGVNGKDLQSFAVDAGRAMRAVDEHGRQHTKAMPELLQHNVLYVVVVRDVPGGCPV